MERLGMVTIGQAPRTDVAPILERYLEGRAELVQAGALDGCTKEEIDTKLKPEPGEYVLTSRLTTGESAVFSREKIQPILQRKIRELEEAGIHQILLLCTGVFPGLKTTTAHLIEPDHIIPPAVKAMAGGRRLGVLVPLREQTDSLLPKYTSVGLNPVFGIASPYRIEEGAYEKAAEKLKDEADLILLDCMGYTEEARERVHRLSGKPVVLSNALMAKLVSEMI
ncbi:AroM family protein [Paenibacillus aurantius]|uniref:AroM family protein n=1 Tax=Paenibacillus aurantius TaxID=2918900 RepID=A0AA96LHT0_9BACL|nr:AroM family protein [Paenibacillus aurantius]WNQ12256.1 AroM family protein [Paenibacillus aurantius]